MKPSQSTMWEQTEDISPKPTQATKATEETKENESESSTSGTDESIIDGETDLEIETDEVRQMNWIRLRMIYSGRPGRAADPVPSIPAGRESSSGSIFPGPRPQRATRQPDQAQSPIRARTPLREPAQLIRAPLRGPRLRIPEAKERPRLILAALGSTAAYPGSTKGSTAAYPGASSGGIRAGGTRVCDHRTGKLMSGLFV